MARYPSLRTGREFVRVLSGGRRAGTGGLTVSVAPGVPDTPSRVGLAVKVPGRGAVPRNRLKRRLRAAVAHCGLPSGIDVVVRADDRVAELGFQELAARLGSALAEATSARDAA